MCDVVFASKKSEPRRNHNSRPWSLQQVRTDRGTKQLIQPRHTFGCRRVHLVETYRLREQAVDRLQNPLAALGMRRSRGPPSDVLPSSPSPLPSSPARLLFRASSTPAHSPRVMPSTGTARRTRQIAELSAAELHAPIAAVATITPPPPPPASVSVPATLAPSLPLGGAAHAPTRPAAPKGAEAVRAPEPQGRPPVGARRGASLHTAAGSPAGSPAASGRMVAQPQSHPAAHTTPGATPTRMGSSRSLLSRGSKGSRGSKASRVHWSPEVLSSGEVEAGDSATNYPQQEARVSAPYAPPWRGGPQAARNTSVGGGSEHDAVGALEHSAGSFGPAVGLNHHGDGVPRLAESDASTHARLSRLLEKLESQASQLEAAPVIPSPTAARRRLKSALRAHHDDPLAVSGAVLVNEDGTYSQASHDTTSSDDGGGDDSGEASSFTESDAEA